MNVSSDAQSTKWLKSVESNLVVVTAVSLTSEQLISHAGVPVGAVAAISRQT